MGPEAYKAVSNECNPAKDCDTVACERSLSQEPIFPRSPALDTSTSPAASCESSSFNFKENPENVKFSLQRHLRTSPRHYGNGTSMDGSDRPQSTIFILESQGRTTSVTEESLSQLLYAVFKRFLAQHLRDEKHSPRQITRRETLLRLSPVQFLQLSTDVYEELLRRQSSAEQLTNGPGQVLPYLLPKDNFHPNRNRARQVVGTLAPPRFQDLATDVFYELERRFPRFAGNSISRVGNPDLSTKGPPGRVRQSKQTWSQHSNNLAELLVSDPHLSDVTQPDITRPDTPRSDTPRPDTPPPST